jgi:hypothetical protein
MWFNEQNLSITVIDSNTIKGGAVQIMHFIGFYIKPGFMIFFA